MTKEQIQEIIGNEWKIIFACKTGSQLFCDNPNDEDIMVVIKDYPYEYKKYTVDGVDLFCQSYDAFYKKATFCSKYPSLYALTWEFAKKDENLICGHFPLTDWSWFDYKLNAVKEILELGERRFFNPYIFGIDGISCSKVMVWALAIYYAIKNNSINYTPEQKDMMCKCHNFKLPKEYAYKLKDQFIELKKELEDENGERQ